MAPSTARPGRTRPAATARSKPALPGGSRGATHGSFRHPDRVVEAHRLELVEELEGVGLGHVHVLDGRIRAGDHVARQLKGFLAPAHVAASVFQELPDLALRSSTILKLGPLRER